ncbi:hypothetical protein [Fictibacillus sp. 18YEL24]|uniref:hypothetical protein n=1 Tax=Fictibacillus sp. 18YEL24 TaxID=2745875 RepID=UPI0018CD6D24|nr:hypothetical protein [Fictibacillus sp. 18YEL24]MBH0169370.1 hypothetical protein [Fictibacillus sp. 18YEL24]
MIQFIVLLISTILVGSLLYFYPPNVPIKLKMSLLGIAFLLALGGLFILDTLSLGLALAAITAISFIAAYLADKRVNFMATTGQTEIVLSFTEEKSTSEKADENFNEIELTGREILPKSELTIDDLQNNEELYNEVSIVNQSIESKEVQQVNDIDSIELLDLENIERISEDESILENINSVQKLTEDHQLAELTEDELVFLSETREISEEEVTNPPDPTDIEDKEILSQRSALLEELDVVDVVEEFPQATPLHEVAVGTEEELSHDKDYESEKNESAEELVAEEILEEIPTTSEEENNTEETYIMGNSIIEIEITSEEPIQVKTQIETPMEEVTEMIESVEVVDFIEEQDEYQLLDTIQEIEVEDTVQPLHNIVEKSTPEMSDDLQDMLLSTLFSYEETDDHSSYQEMLVTLVNQKLSDKDFYLFSKLLLDSYMKSSDLSNVNPLIESMEEKLSHYPVIVEELQRYKEMNK